MSILIFVVIGLALFGSIYWIKPSPKQKRIADQRLKALQLGLQVKLRKFEPNSKDTGIREEINEPHYTLYKAGVKSSAKRWCVVQQAGWEQEGLSTGWSWHDKKQEPDYDRLNQLIRDCQHDVLMIAAFDNQTILISKESVDSSAESIKHWLGQAAEI